MVGHPCDWTVSLCIPKGDDGVEPIPLDSDLMQELLPGMQVLYRHRMALAAKMLTGMPPFPPTRCYKVAGGRTRVKQCTLLSALRKEVDGYNWCSGPSPP